MTDSTVKTVSTRAAVTVGVSALTTSGNENNTRIWHAPPTHKSP